MTDTIAGTDAIAGRRRILPPCATAGPVRSDAFRSDRDRMRRLVEERPQWKR